MKKLLYISLFVINLMPAFGQYDPEALTVLDAMSAKYKKMKAFKASFTIGLTNKLDESINSSSDGSILVKGTMSVINAFEQQIYNNGDSIYSYSKEFNEVSIGPYEEQESDDESISISNVFDLYKEGFKYNLSEVTQTGDRIIKLNPEQREEKSYHTILMVIGKDSLLKSFSIMEKNQNVFLYSITQFEEVDIDDSFFTFNTAKYPGIEIIK